MGQVRDLDKDIHQDVQARSSWQEKQEKLMRQRLGIRKSKAFPFPGAANHNWPLIDKVIRKWKPSMAALILGSDPVAYFRAMRPEGVQAALPAQEYYHWKFNKIDGVSKTALEMLEYVAQYGKCYTRQGWDYQTSRQCRIVDVDALFPQGIEAAVEQRNAQIDDMERQVAEQVQAGQLPSAAMQEIPQKVDARMLVEQTLEQEYSLKRDIPFELQQLLEATERILQGAKKVKFYFRTIKTDAPSWKALNPMDVIVPPRSACLDSDYVAIQHRLSADDLMHMAADGHLDPEAVLGIVERLKSRANSDADKDSGVGAFGQSGRAQLVDVMDRQEGIDAGDIENPEVDIFIEVYCFLDIDGDGIKERCVLWYHPDFHKGGAVAETSFEFRGTVLALHPYAYPFEQWPIARVEFEHRSNRPYGARGIPEHLSVHQATTNNLHNSRLDAIKVTLSPMFQVKSTLGDVASNIKYMPGQMIPVQEVGDIQALQTDANKLIQFLMEENFTRRDAEDYIGLFDPGVLADTATERRTAREVDAIMQQQQSIFGQDARMIQDSMARVHKQLWDLIEEFGPAEEYMTVMGEQQPRLVRKADIAHDFDIVPAGTPANTSQQLAMARAREALQFFAPDLTGLIDKHELYRWYFNVTDRNMGKLIVRRPEEAALIQQMQQVIAQAGQEPAPPP
jgi:hypothetical protein